MVVHNIYGREYSLRIAFGIAMLVILLAGSAGAATNIGACGTISEAGEYVLNQSISGVSTCIIINSSNVTLDGAGYTITGPSKGTIGGVYFYGVYVHNSTTSIENVTVKNLNVTNWAYGIFYNNSAKGNITNNNASSNGVGILLNSSSNNSLTGNTASLNNHGIFLQESSNFNSLTGNNASSNNGVGIGVDGAFFFTSNNNLTGNTASSNDYGIFIRSSYYNNLTDNTASSNGIGIYLTASSRNNFINNTASHNTFWAFYSEYDWTDNNVINLNMNPTISFTGKNIEIKAATAPAPDPNGFRNIGIFINVTNTSADSRLFLNVSYTDAEIAGINESTLLMWQHDGLWSQVPGINGVNTDQKYVFANITNFGIFAPMGASGSTAIPISSCTTISAPGEYVLTQNIINGSAADYCVGIQSRDVVFDGAGYTIEGADSPLIDGIVVRFNESVGLTNVTVKNVTLAHWDYGIIYRNVSNGKIANVTAYSNNVGIVLKLSSGNNITGNNASLNSKGFILNLSSNNALDGNNVSNNYLVGIYLSTSNNNTLSNNNISNNKRGGIYLSSSNNNTLSSNTASNNDDGIELHSSSNSTLINNTMNDNNINFGVDNYFDPTEPLPPIPPPFDCEDIRLFLVWWVYKDSDFDNNVDISNTVDGKTVLYIKNGEDIVYDNSSNAGTIYCIWCNNVTFKNLTLTKNGHGVFFWGTNNSKLEEIDALNNIHGIELHSSNNNTLSDNTASNSGSGIYLFSSSNNMLSGNNASNTENGIWLDGSSNNTLVGNTANSNGNYVEAGVCMFSSSNNMLSGNNASNNYYGIDLSGSSGNTIYDNLFKNNTNNFKLDYYSVNRWNISKTLGTSIVGGPYTGGNFWEGFSQSCADSNNDGICDSTYALDPNNTDYLPLAYSSIIGGTVVSIASQTVTPGSTVTVPIIANNITNLAAYTISLTYNPAVIVVDSVGAGALGTPFTTINNVTGEAVMSAFTATSQSGNFILANVTLRAVGTAGQTSPLNLTVTALSDNNGAAIPATVSNGTFNIASSNLVITASRANFTGAIVSTNNITTGLNTSMTFTVTDGTNSVSSATVTVMQGGSVLGVNTTNPAGQATIIVKAPNNASLTATVSKTDFTNGTKILTAKGDVNGDGSVNIIDALFIAQYTVGTRTINTTVGDVNCDGSANIVDALFIAQYTVGLRPDPTTP